MRTSLDIVVETLGDEADSYKATFLTLVVMDEPVCVILNISYDPIVLRSVEFLLQYRLEVDAALVWCVE